MRVIKGMAALLALIAGVIGVPVILVVVAGNPLPAELDWPGIIAALTRPDDGSILVGLVTIVAWVAWLVFAVSVIVEVVAAASRRRIRLRLPGLAAPQRLASGLVVAVLALAVSSPSLSQAVPVEEVPQSAPQRVDPQHAAVPEAASPRPAANADHQQDETAQPFGSAAQDPGTTHVVRQGDDLWTLAERYYGEGRRWRTIAAANPDLLSGGPDRLRPGWELVIPGAERPADRSGQVLVQRGDTLSSIAHQTLGDHARWTELFELNRFQLDDPDELPVGIRLVLPDSKKVPTRTSALQESERGPASAADDAPAGTSPEQTGVGGDPDALPLPHAERSAEPTVEPTTAEHAPPAGAPAPRLDDTASGAQVLGVDPVVVGVGGVGGLLAAAVLAAVGLRRRVQLQARPVGRRIPRPAPAVQRVETHLGQRQLPMGLRTLDLATRAIAAHCHRTGSVLPELATASVYPDQLVMEMTEPGLDGPAGFVIDGSTWRLARADVDLLRSTPGLAEAVRPYPALVTLGTASEDAPVVTDLESLRLTSIEAPEPELAEAALAAMAVELGCSPWAEELDLVLVGTCEQLPAALGRHSVTKVDDLASTLDRLSRRAASQRRQRPDRTVASHRIVPDLADPWIPTILLINQQLSLSEERQLRQLVLAEPPVSVAVVGIGLADAPCRIVLADSAAGATARVEPQDLAITPQLLRSSVADAVVDLVATTGRTDTAPAPWWFDVGAEEPDPPGNVTYLGRRFGGWARSGGDLDPPDPGRHDPDRDNPDHDDQEGAAMERIVSLAASHPVLRLLGPVELEGAAGPEPTRAAKQCLEYCAWLLEYPGTKPQAMASALGVAEGTRRSNMSRLRSWLGSDEVDQPYLPDAYSGRIMLHPSVSSDWQRLQIITGRGINRTGTSGLEAALRLVRGAPLADAAPGQWHWAEGLRTDMISVIRDTGVELAERALAASDLELARWAATRALLAAPGDELLLVARIKTEHRAGNYAEVERLTLQLAAHARNLEVDLLPETVEVLQEMMEGRVRARLA